MEKQCSKCYQQKQLEAFWPNKHGKHGRHSVCRVCMAEMRHPGTQGILLSRKLENEKLAESGQRRCVRCKEIRLLSMFAIKPDGNTNSFCCLCNAARKRKGKYGLTEGQYAHMLRVQKNRCLVCHEGPEEGKRLVVDHNHATGEIRGLLCGPCNTALGLLNEDTNRMRALIDYVVVSSLACIIAAKKEEAA